MKINELKILSQHLTEQIDFYSNVIGLVEIERNSDEVVYQVGSTKLYLKKSDRFHPYHFAINIPCNQDKQALQWLKERVTILLHENHEIQNFDSWNARAIYFYDRDLNIVEFIARRDLSNESDRDFGSESLMEISEIGLPVKDIRPFYHQLNKVSGLTKYDGNLERFCAIGDEQGLFICINKMIKGWFPTDDKAHSSVFEISFEEQGRQFNFAFEDEELKSK